MSAPAPLAVTIGNFDGVHLGTGTWQAVTSTPGWI
jgi:FAD synthase